ncbi:MAG: GNAT family N-acetyltransferase [Chloroflexi bacterium]|nr:GNAT family N-acetyltransferase [Chloroflexota bacterium]
MRLNLGRKPEKTPESPNTEVVKVRKTGDSGEIISHLEQRRGYAVTGFARLEPNSPEVSQWYIASGSNGLALSLIARGAFSNYVFTMGSTPTLHALLGSVRLPGRTLITCQPEHVPTIEEYYELEWHLVAKRMMVDRKTFRPVQEKAIRLRPAQIHELNQLYGLEGSGSFSAAQIRKGVFYGIWREDRLVAAAGTHAVAPSYGIAYVGNVMTRPECRNQGLAKVCVSSVTAELLEGCVDVVLNVEADNVPAVRAYTSLGYCDDCVVVEAVGRRKSFVGAIINSVCRRLGLISPRYEEGVVDG